MAPLSGPVKALIICWSLAAVIFVGGLALYLLPGAVNAESLARSVQFEFNDGYEVGQPCTRLAGDRWRCPVTDDGGNRPDGYYVVTTGSLSDWSAKRLGQDNSEFAKSAPTSLSSYVSNDDAHPDGLLSDSVIALLVIAWILLVVVPAIAWLVARSRKNWNDDPPAPPVAVLATPTRPVSATPEKPGS